MTVEAALPSRQALINSLGRSIRCIPNRRVAALLTELLEDIVARGKRIKRKKKVKRDARPPAAWPTAALFCREEGKQNYFLVIMHYIEFTWQKTINYIFLGWNIVLSTCKCPSLLYWHVMYGTNVFIVIDWLIVILNFFLFFSLKTILNAEKDSISPLAIRTVPSTVPCHKNVRYGRKTCNVAYNGSVEHLSNSNW